MSHRYVDGSTTFYAPMEERQRENEMPRMYYIPKLDEKRTIIRGQPYFFDIRRELITK